MRRYKLIKYFLPSLGVPCLLVTTLTSCAPDVNVPKTVGYGVIKSVTIDNATGNYFWDPVGLFLYNLTGSNILSKTKSRSNFDYLENTTTVTYNVLMSTHFLFKFDIDFTRPAKISDADWDWIKSPTFSDFSPAELRLSLESYPKNDAGLEPSDPGNHNQGALLNTKWPGTETRHFDITATPSESDGVQRVLWNATCETCLFDLCKYGVGYIWMQQRVTIKFLFDDIYCSYVRDKSGNTWGFKYDKGMDNKYFWFQTPKNQ